MEVVGGQETRVKNEPGRGLSRLVLVREETRNWKGERVNSKSKIERSLVRRS